jgi:hypothetical protein
MRSLRASTALLGAGFVVAGLTGRAQLLVRPWFVLILVATGVLLILAAAKGTRLLSTRSTYALLLPVAVGATLTPAIVSHASQGSANVANLSARLGDPGNPLLAGKGGNVTLLQILLAEKQEGGVALAGRPVTVEAIVVGQHRLERSVIVCCAADAQTVSLTESGTALPRSGSWVRVSGALTSVGNTVVLDARVVTRIPTPSEPFL